MENIKDLSVKDLPQNPGVYIMKDTAEKVLYVGKAKNLRHRVSSYFTKQGNPKTKALMKRVFRIDHIITNNEYEALVLENNLIKKWKPRYNINLKDGKTYPVLKITNEPYPYVYRTRRIINDGSIYYGPFPGAGQLDRYLSVINKLFPIRKCRGKLKPRTKPCLYYHIGRCLAPCAMKVDQELYNHYIAQIKDLLSGKTQSLIEHISQKMEAASQQLDFEKASFYRDSLESIRIIESEQHVQDFTSDLRDYIACARENEIITFTVFQMRSGKMVGRDLYRNKIYGEEDEALRQFILQYYQYSPTPPETLYLNIKIDTETVESYFKTARNCRLRIVYPQKGKHRNILKMAIANAEEDVRKRIRAAGNTTGIKILKDALSLAVLPKRIEGFDISQLGGTNPVASMVSFHNGIPDKSQYRRYHIKSLKGKIDDYAAIREVVARRYTRLLNEQKLLPDLILIDGGKGQVNAAQSIIDSLELTIPVAGLAKREEEIFFADREDPLRLSENSEALKILQQVRDESHRFATRFQKSLRKKSSLATQLEQYSGIGKKRSRKLLETYGSLEEIAKRQPEDIADTLRISPDTARGLISFLESLPRPH